MTLLCETVEYISKAVPAPKEKSLWSANVWVTSTFLTISSLSYHAAFKMYECTWCRLRQPTFQNSRRSMLKDPLEARSSGADLVCRLVESHPPAKKSCLRAWYHHEGVSELRRDGSVNVTQNWKFKFVNLFHNYVNLFNFWKLAELFRNWI